MRTFALFGAKNFGFFEIYGLEGCWASADIFADEGGQFFAILCGRPLWTAPKQHFDLSATINEYFSTEQLN